MKISPLWIAAWVVAWISLLGLPCAWTQPMEQFRKFSAYDCSEPKFIEPVELANLHQCPEKMLHDSVSEGTNASFLVLQEPTTVTFEGYSCRRDRTTIPMYCGAEDHQTMGLAGLNVENPAPLTPAECQTIIADRQVTINREKFKVAIPKPGRPVVSTYKYNSVGETWFGSQDYSCSGGSFRDSRGHLREGWVFYTQDRYTLMAETFTSLNGSMTSGTSKLLLPQCVVSDTRCQVGPWSFFWHSPFHSCQMRRTTVTTGKEYSTPSARGFIAEDESMLSFIITKPTIHCGRPMLETNFPGIFLTDPRFFQDFEEVEPHQMNTNLHQDSKLQFLYDSLIKFGKELFQSILLEFCLSKQNNLANFAQTASHIAALQNGQTIHVGGSIFVSASGEIVYKYFCQHREVFAKETHLCYDSLPIETPANLSRHFTDLMLTEQRIFNSAQQGQLFLEPYTRRIVATASEIPCIELAPYYKNMQDQFVRVSPILSVPALQPVAVDTSRPWKSPEARKLSLAAGGLYTRRLLHEFATFTHLRNFNQAIQNGISLEVVKDKPESGKGLKLATFSQAFGIGSSIAAIFSTILNHGGYIILIAGVVAMYSWLKGCCGCCYRVNLLKNSVTRWCNFKTCFSMVCPWYMHQYSAPGKHRPKPIFNYKINKPMAREQRRQKKLQNPKKRKFWQLRRPITDQPPPVPPRCHAGRAHQALDTAYVEMTPPGPSTTLPITPQPAATDSTAAENRID